MSADQFINAVRDISLAIEGRTGRSTSPVAFYSSIYEGEAIISISSVPGTWAEVTFTYRKNDQAHYVKILLKHVNIESESAKSVLNIKTVLDAKLLLHTGEAQKMILHLIESLGIIV